MSELIVFEGIDGSGKTTLSRMFHHYLQEQETDAIWLREPSDSPAGLRIRELALGSTAISVEEELQFFIEDRRWDIKHNILPALGSGKTVVMDRYFYSNACYQGAKGMDVKTILDLNREFAPEADIVFLIDSDVEKAFTRMEQDQRNFSLLFERREYLEKVRENYLHLSRWVDSLILIDGNGDLSMVFSWILQKFKEKTSKGVIIK